MHFSYYCGKYVDASYANLLCIFNSWPPSCFSGISIVNILMFVTIATYWGRWWSIRGTLTSSFSRLICPRVVSSSVQVWSFMSVCGLYLNICVGGWNHSPWPLLIPDPRLPVPTVRNRATLSILFFASPSRFHYLTHGKYWCQRDPDFISLLCFLMTATCFICSEDIKADWPTSCLY